MLKSFCDICGEVIDRNYATSAYAATWKAPNGLVVRLNVTANIEGKSNRGDLCEACFVKAQVEATEIAAPGA